MNLRNQEMNSIKEFKRIAKQLEKVSQYRSENPEMFTQGSICEKAYLQICEDLEEIIPKANKLIEKWESIVGVID